MRRLSAFSLIEIALVLIILGVLAGAILKGQDLLEAARIRSVLEDINRYRLALSLYQDSFGALPGDDPQAKSRFGQDVPNGNGNGIIDSSESQNVWVHLFKAGHLSQNTPPSSKLGGKFTIKHNPSQQLKGHFLILSSGDSASLLTPKQAQMIKAKAGESSPDSGLIRVIEGSDAKAGDCIQNNQYRVDKTEAVCILAIAF